VPVEASTKQEAIFALVDLIAAHIELPDTEELKQAVWQREQTRTTGIGHGIAIPHGKIKGCDRLYIAIGRLAKPIEFDAVDNKPVDLIFLLVSPIDQTGPHIQALANISRMLTDESFRTQIKQAASADELYKLICDHEAQHAAG